MMTEQEIETMLNDMAEHDGRIEVSNRSIHIWHRAVGKYPRGLVDECFDRFAINNQNDEAPRVGKIKAMCESAYNAYMAKLDRENPKPLDTTKKPLTQWKQEHPGQALQCYENGRHQVLGHNYTPDPNPPRWLTEPTSALQETGQRMSRHLHTV